MGKIIYIRHGKDEKIKHVHDEILTEEGKAEARILAEKLLNEHGVPDIIYYSPFYRTRQTRHQMVKIIQQFKKKNGIDKSVRLEVEPRLGRFFTTKEKYNPDVSKKTLEKGAITDESHKEFKKRVKKQLNFVLKNCENLIVWNITHTLVLLKVAKLVQIERFSYVNYLNYCVIEPENLSFSS